MAMFKSPIRFLGFFMVGLVMSAVLVSYAMPGADPRIHAYSSAQLNVMMNQFGPLKLAFAMVPQLRVVAETLRGTYSLGTAIMGDIAVYLVVLACFFGDGWKFTITTGSDSARAQASSKLPKKLQNVFSDNAALPLEDLPLDMDMDPLENVIVHPEL